MNNLRNILLLVILTGVLFLSCSNSAQSQKEEPWASTQLMNPADLAKTINDPSGKQPIIFCIGPSGLIKNAIDIGPTKDEENIVKLKTALRCAKHCRVQFHRERRFLAPRQSAHHWALF